MYNGMALRLRPARVASAVCTVSTLHAPATHPVAQHSRRCMHTSRVAHAPTLSNTESDYVVVGAGSAGCVMAARLSEDGTSTVTVLEAGMPDRGKVTHG